MVYDPSTDFVGLWRAVLGGVEKQEMPGLDFWVAAMGRAGLINVVFSEVAPTVNQATTAWFRTAHPSYAAEGALYLWDARVGAYVPATPELFLMFLMYFTNDDLLAIWAVIGMPTDDIGKDGDYAIRLDDPGGIYGPKAGGHWPAQPIPATSYIQVSKFLDWLSTEQGSILYRGTTQWNTLSPAVTAGQLLHTAGVGANPYWGGLVTSDLDGLLGTGVWGDIIYRGNATWTRLGASNNNFLLSTHGANANPSWVSLSSIIDNAFGPSGAVQGSVIYRDVANWAALGPSTNGNVLATHGAGANPSWASIAGAGGILDLSFPGATQGSIIYRDAATWWYLPPSSNGLVLTTHGGGVNPSWAGLTSILDANFGGTQGSVLVRTAGGWAALGPGPAGYILTTHGAGADPSWTPPPATSSFTPPAPGSLYPIGSCIVAIDGTALASNFPGGGYMGLGHVATFGGPVTGGPPGPAGYLYTASTPFENNTVSTPWSCNPPGSWMITSYMGGSRVGFESSGITIPSMHDFICTVVRVS